MIDGAPEIEHLSVDLHVHLVEMPAPVAEALHAADPLPADISSEQRTEPVPPKAHSLMTDIDAALEQQVLDITQRQRIANIHQHHEANYLGG